MASKEDRAEILVLPASQREQARDGVRALQGPHLLGGEDLFPPAFLRRHTRFHSLSELLEFAGLPRVTDDQPPEAQARLRAQWGEFLRRSTPFSDWPAMRRAGVLEWARARLGAPSLSASPPIAEPRKLPPGIEEVPPLDREEGRVPPDGELEWASFWTYSNNFYEALGKHGLKREHIPADWNMEIHHTKMKAYAKQYLKFDKIDVHDAKYLRGVPRVVHQEITGLQNAMIPPRRVADEIAKIGESEKRWIEFRKEFLDPVEKSAEERFSKFLLNPTEDTPTVVAKIKTVTASLDVILPRENGGPRIKGKQFDLWKCDQLADRLSFLKKVEKLAAFAALAPIIVGAVKTMYKIYEAGNSPTSDQAFALRSFTIQFEIALKKAENGEDLRQVDMAHFQAKFYGFLHSIDIDIRDDFPIVGAAFDLWVSQLPGGV